MAPMSFLTKFKRQIPSKRNRKRKKLRILRSKSKRNRNRKKKTQVQLKIVKKANHGGNYSFICSKNIASTEYVLLLVLGQKLQSSWDMISYILLTALNFLWKYAVNNFTSKDTIWKQITSIV